MSVLQGIGSALSSEDLKGISQILEEFVVRALLPHLESRVRILYHQVTKPHSRYSFLTPC